MSVWPSAEQPAHVPSALVVDFDFMRPGPEGSDPFRHWTALHGLPPLVWTPRNGGHWLATRGGDVPAILKDHESFSSRRAHPVFLDRRGRPSGHGHGHRPRSHPAAAALRPPGSAQASPL